MIVCLRGLTPCARLIVLLSLVVGTIAKGDDAPVGVHQNPATFVADDGQRKPVTTVAEWERRRADVLAQMQRVMGPLPDRTKFPELQIVVIERAELDGGLRRHKIEYCTDAQARRVRAWLFFPASAPGKDVEKPVEDKRPGMLCLHQTIAIGKDEPAGLGGNPNLHYAIELAKRGFVTLAPDYPSFGEYKYDFPASDGYVSGSMKAIADNLRAVDLLAGLPRVDGERIGCIGHSLGGHNTMFTAVFDPRIKVMVSCCGFTRAHKYYGGKLKGWTSARYMPIVDSEFHNNADELPFDFPEIVAAFAPRAFFTCSPLRDDNFEVSGVRDTIAAALPIYRLYGAESKLRAEYPDSTHDFPPATREMAYQFIEEQLGKP
jgi:dienelactone hydrolase